TSTDVCVPLPCPAAISESGSRHDSPPSQQNRARFARTLSPWQRQLTFPPLPVTPVTVPLSPTRLEQAATSTLHTDPTPLAAHLDPRKKVPNPRPFPTPALLGVWRPGL